MTKAQHTPMTAHGTIIAFDGGGFDVRNCPEPKKLAAFFTNACNNHDELLAALERAQPWITDFLDAELTKDIAAAIAKAKGDNQ